MADHLLEVRNLSVDFFTAAGVVHAVCDISYHLDRGETLAILGESGSGKSVSSSAVMNLIDIPPGKISSGRILLDGEDLLTMPANERREVNGRRIAMIFQDPLSHLNPVYTVGWQIREAMTTHGMDAAKAEAEALRLFGRVGLPDPAHAMTKYPHEFSGGQRQRVMIAMALALRPDLLIADEPTTALDVTVQAEVLALLKELQRETGMAVLIITHDLGVVAEIADRVVVMEKGVLVEQGTVREVYKNPTHPYTKKLIAAAPGQGEMHRPAAKADPLLVVRDVRKRFGAFEALKGISFDLAAGETLAIVGESGSGKSTLARMLLRLDEPDAGTAHWKGRDLFQLSPAELYKLRRELQMVFQDPTQSLNPRMTVFQLISEAWAIHPDILPKPKWRERVAELLVQVGLTAEHMPRYPHQFSGGQRQRIAIARALALEPRLIVCDEAVSALDVSVQAQVIALLDKLRREMGIAFIFIAHDLPVVRDFADHVMVMKKGEVVEMGPVRQVFEAPREAYTRALFAASLDPDPDIQAAHRAPVSNAPLKADHLPSWSFPMSKSAFVALVTCFNKDETINFEATRAQVRRQVAAGNNIMCAGTNGDFTALTFEEKVRLTEEVVDEVAGRARVIVNAGMPATFETIKLAREFDRIGVDGIAVITPFFIACTQDGLVRHFSAIADAVETPVYLYDIPARTQNHIEPQTADTLAKHGNIAGIKDSGGAQQTLEAYLQVSKDNPGFEVYSGPDHLVLWALQNGAAGCISGLGNAMPDVLAGILSAFNAGNLAEAERQQARFAAFRTDLYALGFAPAMVKRSLYLKDPSVGASRQPALLPNEEQDDAIRLLLRKHEIA